MREYIVRYAPSEWDFSAAGDLNVDVQMLQTDPPVEMMQKMVYNERALYVYQRARERCIRAKVSDRLGAVCEDSCMEFFFSPIPEDGRYFNIEVNPLGNVFLGFGKDRYSLVRIFPQESAMCLTVNTASASDGWEVRYKIPIELICLFFPGFELRSGIRMAGNCYKCADLSAAKHYLAWNPLSEGNEDFHTPRDFGSIILE